ncbi:MAG: DUF1638 domain-containing protein [Nocardioides sp.]
MSSSPTAPTSTTSSSTNSPSSRPVTKARRPVTKARRGVTDARRDATKVDTGATALIACGALAQPAAEISARRGWDVDVRPLAPLLHNRPHLIADTVRAIAVPLLRSYEHVLIGYADCGTYGALDDLCTELGLERLPGLHCYDIYGGSDRLARFFAEQPGTYLFTDFLVRSFERTVIAELGLNRHPELRDDYFGEYTRAVWLAQEQTSELRGLAERAAERIGLPLTIVPTGHDGLERALESRLL